MNHKYDGYYDDVLPADINEVHTASKKDIVKKAAILVCGLIVFIAAAVALSLVMTA